MTLPPEPDDAELERLLRRSRALDDAPEALIERAIGLWRPRPLAAPAATAAWRRLAAVLSFDSAAVARQAAGLRAGATAARQLLYSTDGRDIDVRVAPAGDGRHWHVSGQVLGPDEQGTAQLRCGDRVVDAAWNALAEFRFDAVPAGACTLTLRGADWELELPPLELG